MLHALRSLAVFLILLAGSAAAAETKPFAREDMASDAVRLTETLRVATAAIGAQVKGKTPQQLLTEAASAVAGGNFGDAEKLAGAAITAAPKDPANWLAYAGIAAAADDAKANDRYELVTRGATAAYAAYQHSTTPDAQAAALAVLADLLARHEQWRPALDALKASLDRHDLVDVRKTYEAMRAEHGFRILDYKVDNESALAARLLQFLRSSRAPDRFFALCRGVRLVRDRDLERGPADLRRGPQARRALRDRAAPGPALGGRRVAAHIRRLRDLRARPLAAGAFRRPGLRAAARRARRARRSSPSTRRKSRSTSIASATAICSRPSIATTSSSPSTRRGRRRSPRRTERRSGAGRWTSPPSSTRTS